LLEDFRTKSSFGLKNTPFNNHYFNIWFVVLYIQNVWKYDLFNYLFIDVQVFQSLTWKKMIDSCNSTIESMKNTFHRKTLDAVTGVNSIYLCMCVCTHMYVCMCVCHASLPHLINPPF